MTKNGRPPEDNALRKRPVTGEDTTSQARFVPELQSLRGLAAAVVMIHHALRCIESTPATHFVADVLLNAHAAVVLFFVLSGYVLTSALTASHIGLDQVAAFYVRRIFRIYPAMIFGVTLGLCYFLIFRTIEADHLSPFILDNYQPSRITMKSALLTFLGLQVVLLPPLWTITIEIAASIVMPFIAYLQKSNTMALLILTVTLVIASFLFPTGNRWILVYLFDFALGACAFHYRDAIGRLMISPLATAAATAALLWFRQLQSWPYFHPLPGLMEGLASMFVVIGLTHKRASFLRWKPLVHLGDWSFSLYLLHLPVAFALARVIDHEFGEVLSPAALSIAILASTLIISVPLSAWCYAAIEKPSIKLGRRAAVWVVRALHWQGTKS